MTLWRKLEMRLRSVAQGNWQASRLSDDDGQCCLIRVELLFFGGELAGWLKPKVWPLEPRGINVGGLCERVGDWSMVVSDLGTRKAGMLVVQRGEPVGWLRKEQ